MSAAFLRTPVSSVTGLELDPTHQIVQFVFFFSKKPIERMKVCLQLSISCLLDLNSDEAYS